MSGNKTVQNEESVLGFLESIEQATRRRDAFAALKMMKEITRKEPRMWGNSIVGFGTYHYIYDSGREGDFFKVGFSPRKNNMSIYIMSGFPSYEALLLKLGKHKLGKSCLYISDFEKIDLDILQNIIEKSFQAMNEKYPENG